MLGTLVLAFILARAGNVIGSDVWWQRAIFYQIYPRSFQDSNGDGVGDLQGIITRLDYLKELGIGAIWLSPIYESPMVDFGYDVSNHEDIDPVFGTLADFDELIRAVHEHGMRLVMDFIPNHTSDKHRWFVESRKGGTDNPYSDYYCWNDGRMEQNGTRMPINNWLSFFGGSAWTLDESRSQFYLHQFAAQQPDLNYRNPDVRREMMNIIRFWLNRGVDGFRVDAIGTLFEVEDLTWNEPRNFAPGIGPTEHGYLDNIYTTNLDEIHKVVREWSDMIDDYDDQSGNTTFMVMEIYDESLHHTMKYYHSGADMPFNFDLINLNRSCGGQCVHDLVDHWLSAIPDCKWPNFVLGNHDQKRITSRKGIEYVDALNLLLLTLPGTPTTYYGEELGMRDVEISYEDTQDPYGRNAGEELYAKYSRDTCRSPMQWSDAKNSGFSESDSTWLPLHPDYENLNAKVQIADDSRTSHYQVYRQAAILRKMRAFRNSQLIYHVINRNIFSYLRYTPDRTETYLVILNLGNEASRDNYELALGDVTWSTGRVALPTGELVRRQKDFQLGQEIMLTDVALEPGDGLVLDLIMAGNHGQSERSRDEL